MEFQTGELVVYGSCGVCRVLGVERPNTRGPERGREYYLLKPLYQSGEIYTPVEGNKVPLRPVISAGEAEELIRAIPDLPAEPCRAASLQALTQHYQAAMGSYDCRSLLCLALSIEAKRHQAQSQRKRLGMVDERYRKQVQRLLTGEFAVALHCSPDDVEARILQQIRRREDVPC